MLSSLLSSSASSFCSASPLLREQPARPSVPSRSSQVLCGFGSNPQRRKRHLSPAEPQPLASDATIARGHGTNHTAAVTVAFDAPTAEELEILGLTPSVSRRQLEILEKSFHATALEAVPHEVVLPQTRDSSPAQPVQDTVVEPFPPSSASSIVSFKPAPSPVPQTRPAPATTLASARRAISRRRGSRAQATQGRVSSPTGPSSSLRTVVKASLGSVQLMEEPSSSQPAAQFQQADTNFLQKIRTRLEKGRRKHRFASRKPADDAVSAFLYDIGNTGLLNKAEEQRLCSILQKGLGAERFRAADASVPDVEVCIKLGLQGGVPELKQLLRNMEEARELMVQHNLRLVIAIAKKYNGRGVEFKDLIPDGVNGLLRAVEKFDPEKGFKFSTYAHWWIRQAVSRCVTDNSRVVRLPVHVYDTLSKINKVAQELNSQAGRTERATYTEIGAVLGIPAVKVLQYVRAAKPVKSLEQPAFNQSGKNMEPDTQLLVETISNDMEDDEDSHIKGGLIREDINALLSTLSPRERNVIRMRYGLHSGDGTCMTFNDIGAAYGLTKERIRQIEDKALRKLRKPWRTKLLRAHLYGAAT